MLTINKQNNAAGFIGRFNAMASDCEVLVECKQRTLAERIINAVFYEAKRIEEKYSRYLTTNIVYRINNSDGKRILLDEETSLLLNFAYQCHQLSDGLFDITSGVLRQAWHFDGSDNIPTAGQIKKLLPFIGL
ncbi:MAG TPA: FAD:protein FMN transferase, partial [Psychromonas sp.]